MLYRQNGERIVTTLTIVSVTSIHRMNINQLLLGRMGRITHTDYE